MTRSGSRGAQGILVAILLIGASRAVADPIKCERQIAGASAKFAQTKAKALQSCEDKKVAGRFVSTTDCHGEEKTAKSIQKATDNLAKSIAKDCGGADKTCGTSDDEPLLGISWGAIGACPNFENGACNAPITDCNGIVTCLTCVDEAAVDQAIDLYYGSLASDEFGTKSDVTECQRAIGKETTKFLQAKSKALQKCWDERLKGNHSNVCPAPGDGKAMPAIDKAEAKKIEKICKACGGADKACGGGDDLSPSDIGFPLTCPDVTIPGGSSCSNAIVDLQDIVQCVDCVTEFKVDCLDRLAVPEFVPYPPECNGATSTTTVTTSSTTTTTGPGLCGNGVVDPSEPCDPSSPTGAFTCAPGEVCSVVCTCEAVTSTSTSTVVPTSSSTSSSEVPTTSEPPTTSSTSSTTSTTTSTTLYGSPSRAFLVKPPGLLD